MLKPGIELCLNIATYRGHANVVEYILDNFQVGFDYEKPGSNPVMPAVYKGHLDVVKILVAKGMGKKITYNVIVHIFIIQLVWL